MKDWQNGGRMTMHPGLCGSCEHVAQTATKRGGLFYRCQLAQTEPTLRKYPPLPVLRCHGYRPRLAPD